MQRTVYRLRAALPATITLLLLCAACGPKHAELTAPPQDAGTTAVLVKNMRYDDHGLPAFGEVLSERPTQAGGQYTIVYYSGGRPVKSCDIAVVGERKPDITRPFEVLFRWTGQGFLVGASMLGWAGGQIQLTGDRDADMIVIAGAIAPVVVMTAGGFIVGVVAGAISAGEELHYAMLRPQDLVMSTTLFEHDARGRLSRLSTFLPDGKTELVRTEYVYEANGTVPVRAESRSYPENKVRTIGKDSGK